jgi:phage-related baseplate assembly protein
VTLVIIPQSADPRPWPSFGLREEVRRFVAERATADLGATDHIHVTGPDYVAVDVEATVAPLDPAEAGSVEQAARDALQTFLHPLRGGPAGKGWEPGRDVFLSDVASVLERVAGIDYVKELGLMQDGVLQGERVKVAPGRTAVAGDIRLKLVEDA